MCVGKYIRFPWLQTGFEVAAHCMGTNHKAISSLTMVTFYFGKTRAYFHRSSLLLSSLPSLIKIEKKKENKKSHERTSFQLCDSQKSIALFLQNKKKYIEKEMQPEACLGYRWHPPPAIPFWNAAPTFTWMALTQMQHHQERTLHSTHLIGTYQTKTKTRGKPKECSHPSFPSSQALHTRARLASTDTNISV